MPIVGLSSLREDNKDDDSGDEDRYVGGVDSRGGGSGLAVVPNQDDSNASDSIFNLAEQGEKCFDRTLQVWAMTRAHRPLVVPRERIRERPAFTGEVQICYTEFYIICLNLARKIKL